VEVAEEEAVEDGVVALDEASTAEVVWETWGSTGGLCKRVAEDEGVGLTGFFLEEKRARNRSIVGVSSERTKAKKESGVDARPPAMSGQKDKNIPSKKARMKRFMSVS